MGIRVLKAGLLVAIGFIWGLVIGDQVRDRGPNPSLEIKPFAEVLAKYVPKSSWDVTVRYSDFYIMRHHQREGKGNVWLDGFGLMDATTPSELEAILKMRYPKK